MNRQQINTLIKTYLEARLTNLPEKDRRHGRKGIFTGDIVAHLELEHKLELRPDDVEDLLWGLGYVKQPVIKSNGQISYARQTIVPR